MSHYSIDPWNGESIEITFRCPKCGQEVKSDEMEYPGPDYSSETIHDSTNSEEYSQTCPNCQNEYVFEIYVSIADGYVELPFDEKFILSVNEKSSPQFEEYVDNQVDIAIADGLQYENFETAIHNCDQIFGLAEHNGGIAEVLKRQAYSGLVTALESYLSDMMINKILLDQNFFKRFVETYENFTKEQFKVSEYYTIQQKLEKKVKHELTEIIYHNLYKVKKIFENVFGKPFPEYEAVDPIIKNRHHIVHRNGHDKDGNEVEIDAEVYAAAKNAVVTLVEQVHHLVA